ncbi:conjugal transfer protein [Streptomyces alkaliterrae]|uniref:Conjugal transfer protein n=1 Tax=Streptomyces alkaliterrae TaxID=2213162 RepID=A0A5P0YP09_9ACTN|nr:conjugal transfer protein [Streptomyces alkaliterrae]MBB1260164.1 conjugal transfer protein [Streptomyces alkaliterrae]MQS02093.1 hypothetical protein [Streptomyces alkaliterrae]
MKSFGRRRADTEEWGWQMSTGGVALVSRAARWGLWGLVAAGPVLAVGAWAHSGEAASMPVPKVAAEPVAVADTAGPAGIAELFVTSYLTASPREAEQLDVFLPGASARVASARPVVVERSAAVEVETVRKGYWSVSVAVVLKEAGKETGKDREERGEGEPGGVRFFRVPVAAADGGFTAVALPSEVAGPVDTDSEARGLGYGRPGPASKGDPGAATLLGFFEAYLAGRGDVERFVAPQASVRAVTGAPYTQVRLVELAVQGADDGVVAAEVPREGERREVVVELEALEAGGGWRPMTYAVSLQVRDERWEISALRAAPALAKEKGKSK